LSYAESGTENTPDSRFCGGCGAKLQHSEVRVAPTAKIPDDAPFSPPSVQPGQYSYGAGPVSYAPPSMPPQRPPSVAPERPPSVAPNDTRMPSAPPRVAEASLALEVPPRRTGLIATVLVLDLALAAAGAVLLAKGLEKPPVRAAPPAPTAPTNPIEVKPAPAPAPPPAPKPAAAPDGSAAITLPDLGSASPAPVPPKPPTRAPAPPVKHDPTPHDPTPHDPTPQDPYDAAHALSNEVELQSDRTRTDFNRCLDQALQIAPVHGAIRISFDVGPDGRVVKVKAVQNTTGAGGLATCLISTIAAWGSFATHPNHPMTFVRPFTYP
jgi:hypothetical protein